MAHQITSEGGASLAPAAPFQLGAEGGANLAPAVHGVITSEGGANLAPEGPGQIMDRGVASYGTSNLILVSGTLAPDAAGLLAFVEVDIDGYEVHTSNGLAAAAGSYPWTRLASDIANGLWVLEHHPSGDSGTWRNWNATLTGMALDADDWAPAIFNPPTGTPVLSAYPSAAPAQISAEGGANLAPAAPGQIVPEPSY